MKVLEMTGVLVLLTGCSITDIKEKKIDIWWCIAFMIIGMVIELMGQREILNICAGMLPGIFVYVTGILTGGSIGKGDALVMIAAGIFMGIISSIILFICSLFFVAAAALFLLLLKKGNMKTRIPFVPFLTVTFIFLTCINLS